MNTTFHEVLLRRRAVEQRTGLSRSKIYQLIADGVFPKPVQLSARRVAWTQSSIDAWVNERITQARTHNTASHLTQERAPCQTTYVDHGPDQIQEDR